MLNPFSAQSNSKKIDNNNQNLIQQNKIKLSSEKQESNIFDTSNIESNNKITVDKEISQTQNNNQEFSDIPNLEPSPGLSIKYIK